jgi:dihydrofolate reductase
MARIVVVNSVSLDGVMQAPGRPDEDTRDGFEHGGWGRSYTDDVLGAEMGKRMARPGVLLFGRRTYEALYDFWPKQTDGNPYTEVLNNTQKYVVSRTLTEPLPWQNSTLLRADQDVVDLERRIDGHIAILGSGQLVRALAGRGLVDEYVLLIHPLVLGAGQRLFDDVSYDKLHLVDSVPTTTGVIIATYERA